MNVKRYKEWTDIHYDMWYDVIKCVLWYSTCGIIYYATSYYIIYDMIWNDMCYDFIKYVILYNMKWYNVTWYVILSDKSDIMLHSGSIHDVMIWYDTCYMISYDIYYLIG